MTHAAGDILYTVTADYDVIDGRVAVTKGNHVCPEFQTHLAVYTADKLHTSYVGALQAALAAARDRAENVSPIRDRRPSDPFFFTASDE